MDHSYSLLLCCMLHSSSHYSLLRSWVYTVTQQKSSGTVSGTEQGKVSLEDSAHFIGVGLGECFHHLLHSEQQHSKIPDSALTPSIPESISLCLSHPHYEVEETSSLQSPALTQPRNCQQNPITSVPVLPSKQLSPPCTVTVLPAQSQS